MEIIQNIDSTSFTLNGFKYVKNFIITRQGNTNIAIYNYYDTRFQLLNPTKYNQIQVDGVVYTSVIDLMSVLAPILFAKSVSGGGGGTQQNSDWNSSTGVTEILNKPAIYEKTVSTTTPSGVPSDGDEWIMYIN